MLTQDGDDYVLAQSVRDSPSAAGSHKAQVLDADSSGPSDTEEMSDLLKKDPIISKYSKYRVTKRTSQQKSSCKYRVVLMCDSLYSLIAIELSLCLALSVCAAEWYF